MTSNIVLCGVGGQGIVLASRLMATAAMDQGLPVKTAETIGMSQRGGSVFSHVRIGEGAPSPLVGRGRADLILGFEPAETVRQLAFARPEAWVVTSNKPIVPVSATVGGTPYDLDAVLRHLSEHARNLVVVDADAAARDLGSSKCLNVVLLGAAVRSGAIALKVEDVERAIRRIVPERFLDLNLRALRYA